MSSITDSRFGWIHHQTRRTNSRSHENASIDAGSCGTQITACIQTLVPTGTTGKEWNKLANVPASWPSTKAKPNKEVVQDARKKKVQVHFASPMELCHPQHAEPAQNLQKYTGRRVLRGSNVKDDVGFQAVFTEQGVFQLPA